MGSNINGNVRVRVRGDAVETYARTIPSGIRTVGEIAERDWLAANACEWCEIDLTRLYADAFAVAGRELDLDAMYVDRMEFVDTTYADYLEELNVQWNRSVTRSRHDRPDTRMLDDIPKEELWSGRLPDVLGCPVGDGWVDIIPVSARAKKVFAADNVQKFRTSENDLARVLGWAISHSLRTEIEGGITVGPGMPIPPAPKEVIPADTGVPFKRTADTAKKPKRQSRRKNK